MGADGPSIDAEVEEQEGEKRGDGKTGVWETFDM